LFPEGGDASDGDAGASDARAIAANICIASNQSPNINDGRHGIDLSKTESFSDCSFFSLALGDRPPLLPIRHSCDRGSKKAGGDRYLFAYISRC
jgi:hypothetical protein